MIVNRVTTTVLLIRSALLKLTYHGRRGNCHHGSNNARLVDKFQGQVFYKAVAKLRNWGKCLKSYHLVAAVKAVLSRHKTRLKNVCKISFRLRVSFFG